MRPTFVAGARRIGTEKTATRRRKRREAGGRDRGLGCVASDTGRMDERGADAVLRPIHACTHSPTLPDLPTGPPADPPGPARVHYETRHHEADVHV